MHPPSSQDGRHILECYCVKQVQHVCYSVNAVQIHVCSKYIIYTYIYIHADEKFYIHCVRVRQLLGSIVEAARSQFRADKLNRRGGVIGVFLHHLWDW